MLGHTLFFCNDIFSLTTHFWLILTHFTPY